jgi:hypothetical protein
VGLELVSAIRADAEDWAQRKSWLDHCAFPARLLVSSAGFVSLFRSMVVLEHVPITSNGFPNRLTFVSRGKHVFGELFERSRGGVLRCPPYRRDQPLVEGLAHLGVAFRNIR